MALAVLPKACNSEEWLISGDRHVQTAHQWAKKHEDDFDASMPVTPFQDDAPEGDGTMDEAMEVVQEAEEEQADADMKDAEQMMGEALTLTTGAQQARPLSLFSALTSAQAPDDRQADDFVDTPVPSGPMGPRGPGKKAK